MKLTFVVVMAIVMVYSFTGDRPAVTEKIIYINIGCHDEREGWLIGLKDQLQARGYQLEQKKYFDKTDDAYLYVSLDVKKYNLPVLYKHKDKSILVMFEPPSVVPESYKIEYHEPFVRIYTWHDELVDNRKYYKFFYSCKQPMIDDIKPFGSKKLCVLINANKKSKYSSELYSERKRVIDFYQDNHPDDLDLYGRGWDAKKYTMYKGFGGDTIAMLSTYKFCICYENIADQPGYITEKIFNAFAAGCVPVYWGAPNITDYIPKTCFVDRRDFGSDAAVYEHMKNMSEQVYQRYLENIKTYLTSPEAQPFAAGNYVPFFVSIILQAERACYGSRGPISYKRCALSLQ